MRKILSQIPQTFHKDPLIDVPLIDWPARSPDVNPIEYLCNVLEYRLTS